jgi:phosphoglycolate phosphatase-like HAD superfamily hydrolase
MRLDRFKGGSVERRSIRGVEWERGQIAVVDVDGTLVDSTYHHALAWSLAFARSNVFVPAATLHRHVGMGADQFVPAVAGEECDAEHGDGVRAAHDELYMGLLPQVTAFPDAKPFLRRLRDLGLRPVLATSANERELERYLELLDADDLCEGWTSAADVERTKPHPDVLLAAIRLLPDAEPAFVVGDSTWDAVAGSEAGVPMLGVLTGGFCRSELEAAGATAVFSSVGNLASELEHSARRAG